MKRRYYIEERTVIIENGEWKGELAGDILKAFDNLDALVEFVRENKLKKHYTDLKGKDTYMCIYYAIWYDYTDEDGDWAEDWRVLPINEYPFDFTEWESDVQFCWWIKFEDEKYSKTIVGNPQILYKRAEIELSELIDKIDDYNDEKETIGEEICVIDSGICLADEPKAGEDIQTFENVDEAFNAIKRLAGK